ncbi:MAG: hypothetical protein ACE5F5_10450 [Acidimicrobiia bacterium]
MSSRARLYPILAGAAVLPVFVWWLGWYPGFASSDTLDQFNQVKTGAYHNFHPAVHTFYLDLLSQGGLRPGLVTLFQLVALGVLFAYAARRLADAGVPGWLTVVAAWGLGLSPAVAPTTLALWKDVPFGLFLLWAWIELVGLATKKDPDQRQWLPVRLGIALAGMWLFRGNGPITVLLVVVVVVWVYRRELATVAALIGSVAVVVIAMVGPLYGYLGVQGSGIEPAEVFLPDVAASYVARPETFTPEDLELLEAVAPLELWTGRYDCYDSTPLLFDPAFDHRPVRANPDDYRRLELAVLRRDLASVAAHRACSANFVYSPFQPEGVYFHRPPYEIPENDVGLVRDPISDRAFALTDRVWRWAEPESRLWLTWRPAIVVLPALALVVFFVLFRRKRLYLVPSTLFVAHLINVAATSPSQEFRYAYPLYLVAVFTLTLAWPALRPEKG